jgi:tetratricopeptide (TPR) repeat protein
MQQRNGEAVEVLSEAAKLNPKDLDLQTNLGTALQQAGDAEQAKAAYRAVLASQPENPVAANNLAFLLAQQGRDLDEALRLAKVLVTKFPGNPNYADTLALTYLKKGSTDAAIHILTGLTNGPNCSAICRIHLGMAFSSKGDTTSARNQLELALHNQPTIEQQSTIHNLLANLDHSAQESRLRH